MRSGSRMEETLVRRSLWLGPHYVERERNWRHIYMWLCVYIERSTATHVASTSHSLGNHWPSHELAFQEGLYLDSTMKSRNKKDIHHPRATPTTVGHQTTARRGPLVIFLYSSCEIEKPRILPVQLRSLSHAQQTHFPCPTAEFHNAGPIGSAIENGRGYNAINCPAHKDSF